MAQTKTTGVSGAVPMALLALALAACAAYGATAVEIGDLPALVLITFVPPAGLALIAAGLDIAAATTGGAKGQRLFEIGLVLFGISLGWLALCGVMAAGAAVLEPDSLAGD